MKKTAIAKLCVRSVHGGQATALFGVAIEKFIEEGFEGEDEMWECEITIRPLRKWRQDDRKHFVGQGIAGMMKGDYHRTEYWNDKPYYDTGECDNDY